MEDKILNSKRMAQRETISIGEQLSLSVEQVAKARKLKFTDLELRTTMNLGYDHFIELYPELKESNWIDEPIQSFEKD